MSKCRDIIAIKLNTDANRRQSAKHKLCSIIRHFYDFDCPTIMILSDRATT